MGVVGPLIKKKNRLICFVFCFVGVFHKTISNASHLVTIWIVKLKNPVHKIKDELNSRIEIQSACSFFVSFYSLFITNFAHEASDCISV